MDCTRYREAISARIDGEELNIAPAALDAHLAGCRACRRWAEAASRVTRAARLAPAGHVPDLTAAILSRAPAPPGRPAQAGSPAGVARFGLALVAAAQLCLAVPALLGDDAGAPIHIAHEQGAWALALAAGLLTVAWRPARAAALLPLVAVLAAGLAVTMGADIAAGRTQAAAEAPHGLAFLGVGLLWVLARCLPTRPPRRMARPA